MTMLRPIFIFSLCLNLVSTSISPCAKWNRTGRTVAGTGEAGSSDYQINSAKGFFIQKERRTLYVADFYNNRVQMFPLGSISPMGTTIVSNVVNPMKVFIDEDETGPTVYVSLRFLNRTEKWVTGAKQGVQVGGECVLCSGVAIDKDKNVYLSESGRHRVVRWNPETNETVVIAGQTDTRGSTTDLLDHPQGLYLDQNSKTIYVADMWNSRIQRWNQNAIKGTTVAGSPNGKAGNDSFTLNYPNDVIVDDETNVVYVIDSSNHRVQRWTPNATQADTIAGGAGSGNGTNQLNKPVDIAFDKEGNLYVLDMENNRVQMFELIEDRPCTVIPPVDGSSHLSMATILLVPSLLLIFMV